MKGILDKEDKFRQYLARRGFLVTDATVDTTAYPFYGAWKVSEQDGYQFIIHPDQNAFFYTEESRTYFLVGHAYNPFTMIVDEDEILKELSSANDYFDKLNELTGSFTTGWIENTSVTFVADSACMQQAFYGEHNGHLYISSHSMLIGDLCELELSDYVKRLINYKYYHLFGIMLPGDIAPYDNFCRIIPNHAVIYRNHRFDIERFYSVGDNSQDITYDEIIRKSAEILNNNLDLIAQKWNQPAISMTGGCDSKTTLACATGLYDKFKYFSYVSSDAEQVDVDAAKSIASQLGLAHHTYEIPKELPVDYDIYKQIIEYNMGNIGKKTKENEIIKRIYFLDNNDFGVEVKSWASEIARAYFSKRFLKTKFPRRPTPRYLTTLYKVFLHDRALVKETDKKFADFLSKYYKNSNLNEQNWIDTFFWEFRVGAWNGLVLTGEHKTGFDITVPYNNRKLLGLLLQTPYESRISDKPHHDIQKLMNQKIYDMVISVVNVKHTSNRARMERLYLEIHSRLPF